jgi:hypothetical protein
MPIQWRSYQWPKKLEEIFKSCLDKLSYLTYAYADEYFWFLERVRRHPQL